MRISCEPLDLLDSSVRISFILCEATFESQPIASCPDMFADPVFRETTAIELRTLGRIPEELEGRLVRIGPCPIGARDPALYHWFTGTGLVHGLRLRGGRAEWYRSRFTLSADAAEALGKRPISGPGEPHLPVNTNVVRIGGHLYAVVEAGARPIELDNNLESIARSNFGARSTAVSPPIRRVIP